MMRVILGVEVVAKEVEKENARSDTLIMGVAAVLLRLPVRGLVTKTLLKEQECVLPSSKL
jgi:hypothetical protein